MFELKIGVRGAPQMSRRLGLAIEVLQDLRPVWEQAVHPFMLAHMERQFATEGRYGGAPWDKYSREPKYRAYKRAIVGHLDVLRWQKGGPYEQLYPSLVDPLHIGHVWQSRKTGVAFGTRIPYAERLNKGGVGPFGEPYPGREIIGMRPGQRKALITEIQRAILARFGADELRRARVT